MRGLEQDWQKAVAALGTIATLLTALATGPAAYSAAEPFFPASHQYVTDHLQQVASSVTQQIGQEHDSTAAQLTKIEQLVNIADINSLRASLAVLEGQQSALQALLVDNPSSSALSTQVADLTDQITAIQKMLQTAECNLVTSGQSTKPC